MVFYTHRHAAEVHEGGARLRLIYKLATLLFTFVFRHRTYLRLVNPAPTLFGDWFREIDYFLRLLPEVSASTEVLFELYRGLGRGSPPPAL